MVFHGTNGWIGNFDYSGTFDASDRKIWKQEFKPTDERLYVSEEHNRNFIDCVKTRQETITPAEVAHRSISVGLLGEIAMQTGRKLKWDPENEKFIGDDNANRYLMRSYRGPWHL